MENYIAYYRMSKIKKGKTVQTSYGLEAQRQDVTRYVTNDNGAITDVFTEIETGTKRKRRIEVYKAINQCKLTNSTLIVAKLDRLARDVQFVAELLNSGIKFICVENPSATPMVLQIMAAISQNEAETIRARIKRGLAVAKEKGVTIGDPSKLSAEGRNKGVQTRIELAKHNANNVRATAYVIATRAAGDTYQQIADKLNAAAFRTSKGKLFTAMAVYLLYQRAQRAQAA